MNQAASYRSPDPQPEPAHKEPVLISAGLLTLLRYLLVFVSLLTIVLFFGQAAMRLRYPYELNENNMLDSVRQILAGTPLYVMPGVHFVPFLYTPIFYYVAAGMTKLTGVNFLALRAVSLLSTLGCFGVIYALVYAEVRKQYAAIAAVACFASCYPLVIQWFDIGRVDMLYLFFVLCAWYATRKMNPVIAALLWVCAFQTKQGVLPIALLALCHDWQRPRRALLGIATFVVGLGASIAWLSHITGGWYRYYVFGTAGGFAYDMLLVKHYIPTDLFAVIGIALLVVAAAALATPPHLRSRATSFYLCGIVGMVIYTGFIRGHRGSAPNAVMPAYIWIAILFGIALARLGTLLEECEPRWGNTAMALVLAAASMQIVMHLYSPREFVPSAAERGVRDAFTAEIRSIPGDVLVFAHPEYGVAAGKSSYAEINAAGTVIDAKNRANGDRLIADYAALIHSGSLSAVVLDRDAEFIESYERTWIPRDFLTYYPLAVRAIGSDDTEFGDQPRWIYFSCASADAAKRLDPQLDATSPCKTQGH